MDELVFRLLIQSHVSSFSKEDIHLQLLSHKDYPSIKAITDTLDYFGVDNVAANIPKDALPQLPKLFLALIEEQEETELVLVTQKKQSILIRTIDNKREKLSLQDFSKQWTGTVIAIEQDENVSTSFKKYDLTTIAAIVISLLSLGALVTFSGDVTSIIYTSLALVGLGVSYLITKESLGLKDNIAAKVCGALSSKIDSCNTVITSKEGKIGKGFGLGDASILYFGSAFFIITCLGLNMSMLFVVSILSLFVVVYSLFLQGIQLKRWCSLCLIISVVLISQFGTLLVAFSSWDVSLSYLMKASVLTLSLGILWYHVKPLIVKSQELRNVKRDYITFKRNEDFFITALEKDSVDNLKTLPKEAQVFFGNANASIQLTAYTNPLCGYCVAAFEVYDRLLTQFPNDISVQFIFNTPEDLENPSTQIAKRILEKYHKDSKNAFEAFKDWFAHRDVDQWMKKYGSSNSMLLMDDRILQMHRDVANDNNIQYTPETLIGNQKFPREEYEYEDLLLFVGVLKEKSIEMQKRVRQVL